MNKGEAVLLFGGTAEGHKLYDFCHANRIPAVLSVASSYGVQVLDHVWDSSVRVGRANEEKIEHWLQSGAFSLVIDATHPYAKEVTANIKQACFRQGIRYLRLLRDLGDQSGALEFASAQKAAAYLANTQGNILLTIGSREIDVFAPLNKDQKRIFARILPAEDSIAACRRAGVTGRNLLCMQGPFSADFTYAALREFQCRFLVTKNSGSAGGFEEKMEAARRAGVQVLVIRRPEEDGFSFNQVQAYLLDHRIAGEKRGKG